MLRNIFATRLEAFRAFRTLSLNYYFLDGRRLTTLNYSSLLLTRNAAVGKLVKLCKARFLRKAAVDAVRSIILNGLETVVGCKRLKCWEADVIGP